jgi:hypothetical protein
MIRQKYGNGNPRMELIWTKVSWIAFAYLSGTFSTLAKCPPKQRNFVEPFAFQ